MPAFPQKIVRVVSVLSPFEQRSNHRHVDHDGRRRMLSVLGLTHFSGVMLALAHVCLVDPLIRRSYLCPVKLASFSGGLCM